MQSSVGPSRRPREYTRIFKACDSCRKKKTRCILDASDAAEACCRRCARERKECSLSKQDAAQTSSPGHLGHDRSSAGSPTVDRDLGDFFDGGTPWTFSNLNQAGENPNQSSQDENALPSAPSSGDRRIHQGRVTDFTVMATPSHLSGSDAAAAQQAVMQASITNDGDAMRVILQSSQGMQQRNSRHEGSHQGDGGPLPPAPSASTRPACSELSTPDRNTIRLWNSFRFVRMGWLNAREAVTYVDLQVCPHAPRSRVC